MDYGKMIKLLLPNNTFIKIQISGDENELKDLLSTVIDLSPSQIKGIKDSNGNYYTLSSAISNSHFLQKNENIYYELILGKTIEKKNEQSKNISFSLDYKNSRNNIILNTSPKVGNYYANYFINENNNQLNNNQSNNNNQLILNFRKRESSFNEINDISKQNSQLFSSYLIQFLSLKLINDDMLFELNKMMNEHNKDLYKEFNQFKKGNITQEKYINNLYNLYNDRKKAIEKEREKNVLSSTSLKSKQFIKELNENEYENKYKEKIYETMKEYFEGENLNIIRLTLKYENENIMIAIKKFKEDLNLINLIEAFQKAIRRFKKKTSQTQKFFNTFSLFQNKSIKSNNFEKEYIRREERYYSSPQGIIESEINNYKKIIKSKIQNFKNKKNKINQTRKHSSIKVSNNIQKNLNQYNKYFFEYILNNNKNEYNYIQNIYIQKKKYENINKMLNDYCQEIINKEIKNYGEKNNIQISNNHLDILNNFFSKNNLKVKKSFENLTKHNSIDLFCEEIISIINKIKVPLKSIRNKIDKNRNEKIILEFINDLDKINIQKKEKEKIIALIKTKNSKLINIINEYKQNKNISLYGKKIKDILNKENIIISNLKTKDSKKKIFNNSIISLSKNASSEKESIKLGPNFSNITMHLIQAHPNTNFEKILFETNSFTDNEIFFLRKKFSEKNTSVLSIYDSYENELDLNEFKSSLKSFLQKEYNEKNIIKKEINNNFLFFSEPNIENIDKLDLMISPGNYKINNVLNKQKEIISILYNENCIDKNTYDIINNKIEKDDKGLISAFEVYAITKDHLEFIETLTLISSLK